MYGLGIFRSMGQCGGLTLVCLVLKGGNFGTNQHETNESKTIMWALVCVYNCDGPNLEWSVLWRVHAQLEARLYTWRWGTLHGVLLCTTYSVNEPYPTGEMIPACARGLPPHGSLVRKRLVANYYALSSKRCRTVSCWDDGKRKTKRGWSPGDSLILLRVLSVRVNYN